MEEEKTTMKTKIVAEGKIFYQYGSYTIMIDGLAAATTEKIVQALRTVGVLLHRKSKNY